jgi:AbrB family looped-hinge helix DNA binding protein
MATSSMTSKGQITIPIEIRRALGLAEGDRLEFEQQGETVVMKRALSVAERTAGILSKYRLSVPITPEEERESVEWAIAEDAESYE